MKTSKFVGISPTILAVFVSITVFPWMMDSINIPKLAVLAVGAVLILSIICLNIDLNLEVQRNKVIILLIFAALLCMLLSSIANPQNLYTDLIGGWRRNNGILAFLAFSALLLSVIFLGDNFSQIFVIKCLTWIGGIFGIYAWLQIKGIDPLNEFFPWYNTKEVMALTFGNTNFASVFLGFTFTASIGYFLFSYSKTSKSKRLILLISIINQWALVRYIDTQGKIIYAVGASIVIGIWLLASGKSFLRNLGMFWVLLTSLVGTLGVTGLFGFGPFAVMLENNVTNLKDRYFHWLAAIKMMKENWLFGVGIDSFGEFHRQFRVVESIALRGTPRTSTDNAHNVFLQLGATVGIPFLVFYIFLVCFITYRGVLTLRTSDEKVITGALFGVWIGYLIQSLVSIDQLGITVWGWLAGGSLLASSKIVNSKVRHSSNSSENNLNFNKLTFRLNLGIAILVFATLLPTVANEIAIFNSWKKLGNSKSQTDAVKNATELLEIASKSNQPKLRIYIADTLGKSGFIVGALNLAQSTADRFPREYEAWDMVASINEANGYRDRAIFARKKTVELDPLNLEISEKLRLDESAGTP